MPINLKFFQKYPNAGDQFSLRLAHHFFGPDIAPCGQETLTQPNLVLIGSILHWSDSLSQVCGAGILAPEFPPQTAPAAIHCVRGPLSAGILEARGIKAPEIFGDPGMLAPLLFPAVQPVDTAIGIIPHYVDEASPWVASCKKSGARVIDVLSPLEEYFSEVQRCEVILSSSLHGIIFAHAYGKPALWISLSDRVIGNGFKFLDYYRSVGVPMEKVRCVHVEEHMHPGQLVRLATCGNQAPLLAPLQSAIDKARCELMKASQ